MNTEDFNKCREFLEKCILEKESNSDFIQTYAKLIELKSNYDLETDKAYIEKQIREAEFQAQYNTAVHTNNTDFNKSMYQNNTDFNIAQNNNQAANYQHQQGLFHSTVNNALNNGYFPRP